MLRRLIAGLFAAAILTTPAYAAVDFTFGIQIAPPPARVEVVPESRPGYVWAPGYWGWEGGQHVWIDGRWIAHRPGYYYAPERWVEYRDPRGPHWHLERGRWEREHRHEYRR